MYECVCVRSCVRPDTTKYRKIVNAMHKHICFVLNDLHSNQIDIDSEGKHNKLDEYEQKTEERKNVIERTV